MKTVFLEMEKLRHPQTGLGQFCLHLGRELVRQNNAEFNFHFYLPQNQFGVFGQQHYVARKALHKIFPPSSHRFDLWHCFHQDSPYMPSATTPLLLTIHDLNFLQKYHGIKRKYRLANLQKKVNRAAGIAVISGYTADILRDNIRLPDVPVKIIYNGNSLSTFEGNHRPVAAPVGPFFFAIGVLSPRKNFHVLPPVLRAFPMHSLLIAGPSHSDYAEQIRREAIQYGVEDRLVFAGEVSDEDRYWYYNNCAALLFPSLAEGFGLPVVEAMSLGKPVFLSRLTSLPELGGECAFYFDRFDADSVTDTVRYGMKKYTDDPAYPKRLMDRAHSFSWQKAAEMYLQFYREI